MQKRRSLQTMVQKFWRIVGILAVVGALVACVAPSPSPGAEGEAASIAPAAMIPPSSPGDVLIVALPLDPNSINPPNAADRMAGNVINQIFDSLIEVDNVTNELRPSLATEWTVSEDGMEYTFKLRQGVRFHDGSPFDAQDIVATFEAGRDPANAYASAYANVTVEVVDDFTVKLKPNTPDVTFLRSLVGYNIISNEQFAAEGNAGIEIRPIGTGPFKFVEWVKGSRIVLEAFEEYWEEGKPHLQQVIFRPIPESSTRLAAIQTGEVHIINRLNADEAKTLEGVDGIELITYPADRVYYIAFNNLTTGVGKPTEDVRVRQAMNYAVDRQAIVDSLFGGYARLSAGFVTPWNLGFDESLQPYPYDPERARALLAEAGYPDGFTIGMACPIGAYTSFEEVCQAVANYLAEVGITLEGGEIEFLESGVYWDRQSRKELPPLFGDSWSAAVGEALPRLVGALGGWQESYSAWSDPEIDRYLAAISSTFDLEKRAALYKELQAYMYENPPFIYLYEPITFEAIRSFVKGYAPNSVEQYYLKHVHLAE
uniref:ABC transporter substrate-binding protein n=1 Tax=Caldilinea aerophila TaxID=133453 RepID=A0A7C1FGV0_9CHLR